MTADFEKLGLFYLGRSHDSAAHAAGSNLVLYDSKDLVTHAVCVGMTGSGKTGLCLNLLEEAAIDGIPAIVIDPKARTLTLDVPADEIARRMANWRAPDRDRVRPGSVHDKYIRLVSSAHYGCVL